jgi:hypothetical protein
MEHIQNGMEVRTSRNTRGKNKKTLTILVSTIIALIVISVVYIIIYPKL